MDYRGLQAAIIGTGSMGGAHTQALRRLGIPIGGVLGSSPEKSRAFADTYSLPRIYEDLASLLADPQVKVVHVCTPTVSHFPLAKAALESGRHVVVEKPLAMNSSEALELNRLAKQKGLAAVVNHNMRFLPFCLEARIRVRMGEVGEIRLIQGGYCQDWLFDPGRWNWRVVADRGGQGRAIGDIGTHWYDLVTWISGQEVSEVVATQATFIPERKAPGAKEATVVTTEDAAQILMRFNQGTLGSLTISQLNAGRKNYLWYEFSGSKESLAWNAEDMHHLWLGHEAGANEVVEESHLLGLHESARKAITFPGGQVAGYLDTFVALYQQVYTALAAGNLPDPALVPTFQAGCREMVWVDAVLQSAREGRWVKLNFGE